VVSPVRVDGDDPSMRASLTGVIGDIALGLLSN
jgi:hypothetical protein